MIINFSTIIYSIFITESNVSLVLSIYTLSFSILCDNRIHIPLLEKLIIIYQDDILPEINARLRKYNKKKDSEDIIYEIQGIEKEILNSYFGKCFVIPKSLRTVDWKKITIIFVIYILSFISIAVVTYCKSKGIISL